MATTWGADDATDAAGSGAGGTMRRRPGARASASQAERLMKKTGLTQLFLRHCCSPTRPRGETFWRVCRNLRVLAQVSVLDDEASVKNGTVRVTCARATRHPAGSPSCSGSLHQAEQPRDAESGDSDDDSCSPSASFSGVRARVAPARSNLSDEDAPSSSVHWAGGGVAASAVIVIGSSDDESAPARVRVCAGQRRGLVVVRHAYALQR